MRGSWLVVMALAACGQMPVVATDRAGEFVVAERHTGPFATLSNAKAHATARAVEHCRAMGGKKFVERYSVDKPRTFLQLPESTLYFACVD